MFLFAKLLFEKDNFNNLYLVFLGIVGEMDDKGESLYVWTHKKFEIGFNGKQVGDVDIRVTLTEN